MSINDDGVVNVYPVYKYSDSVENIDLNKLLQKYAEDYKTSIGLEDKRKKVFLSHEMNQAQILIYQVIMTAR